MNISPAQLYYSDSKSPDRTYIRIRTRWEGFHRWRDAPNNVSFLRDLHRHEFHLDVIMGVEDADREIETITMKRWLIEILDRSYLKSTMGIASEWSCEQIAEYIGYAIQEKYGSRFLLVEVLEDGENGGGVMWEGEI